MTAEPADNLVILLHGVAAFGYDLEPLRRVIARAMPRAIVVAPDAPTAFEQGPGRQWYSQDAITPAKRIERVAAARKGFDLLISSLAREHGFDRRPERVALVGFSQGAIMALDVAATGRWPLAAIVGLSGRLATAEPLSPSPATRIALVHGADDSVAPAAESERAFALLTKAGAKVEMRILPGVGHIVAPRAATLTARFVRAALQAAATGVTPFSA